MKLKTAKLREDVFSTFKLAHQYGKKGEMVTVVGEYGDAIIVKNKFGNRYSVRREKLIYEKMY
jgi:hypothetical protein